MQEGHYVQEKEFSGIGITPFDPYHNSSFVVAGESKRRNGGGRESCSLLSFSLNRNHRVGKREKTLFSPAEDKSRRKTSLFLRRDFAGSPGNPALPRSVSAQPICTRHFITVSMSSLHYDGRRQSAADTLVGPFFPFLTPLFVTPACIQP